MGTAPDPGRIKAICKQRHNGYTVTCIIGPLAIIAFFQQVSSRPHGHASPLALATCLLGLAAFIIGELIWRCPACKGHLPRGFAPAPPPYCPQCAVPLADPSERRFAGSKEARRFVWGLLGFLMIFALVVHRLVPPGLQAVTDRRGGAAIFTQPTVEDVAHLRRQLREVDRHLAAHRPGAMLQGSAADLPGLQRLLDECRRKPGRALELQCLGVAFGNVLARETGMHWIIVLDDEGRDPALQYRNSSLIVFPFTMISQRVEAGKPVDLTRLLAAMRALVRQHVREADPASRSI